MFGKHPFVRYGVCLILVLGMDVAQAAGSASRQCIIPTTQVTSFVAIRESPSAVSLLVGKLLPNQEMPLTGEVPNWYLVELPNNEQGYISKRWADPKDCSDATLSSPIAPAVPTNPDSGPSFELDAIDVGTGLSVFVHGPDFSLLYDAGSMDDMGIGPNNRTVAFLKAVYPDLETIDHVVLSHAHQDHVYLLADVLKQYRVGDVWDSGAEADSCGYRAFLEAVAATPGVRYHTATLGPGTETRELASAGGCDNGTNPASHLVLNHGSRVDTNEMPLGAHGKMTFLYVDAKHHADLNSNSLVLRLDLGTHSVLLMGDAEGGERKPPSTAPSKTSIESSLLRTCCVQKLKADLMVVGHHGSKTSSRTALLDAVAATNFLVSSGPHPYKSAHLPDQVIIDELQRRGHVFCTNVDDQGCQSSETKIGQPNDNKVGGCSNIRVAIDQAGVRPAYFPAALGASNPVCMGHGDP